jgi:hypothetical protein
MLELLKEAKSEFMKNPKECLQDSVVMLLIFAMCYFMLVLGSVIGLQ